LHLEGYDKLKNIRDVKEIKTIIVPPQEESRFRSEKDALSIYSRHVLNRIWNTSESPLTWVQQDVLKYASEQAQRLSLKARDLLKQKLGCSSKQLELVLEFVDQRAPIHINLDLKKIDSYFFGR